MAERIRITKFDVWFFRVMWIGAMGTIVALVVWLSVIANDIGRAYPDGAARMVGIILVLQAVLIVTLTWGAFPTPRQWRVLKVDTQ